MLCPGIPDPSVVLEFLVRFQFGFSLDKTQRDAMNPYLDNHQDKCLLQGASSPKSELDPKPDDAIIYFTMDLKNLTLVVYQKKIFFFTSTICNECYTL